MPGLIRTLGASLLILVFLVPLGGYLLGWFGEAGTSENRALADWPRWGDRVTEAGPGAPPLDLAQHYTAGVDAHLSDRFGARMSLIRLARKVKDNLGEDPEQVVRGKDGYLFLGETALRDEFEGVGAWSDDTVEQWVADLRAVRDALEESDVPFAASIPPDKARIYAEYLPDDWREGGRRFRSRVLTDPRLDGIAFDADDVLLQAKANGEQVYFRRDTHWTNSGGQPFVDAFLDRIDPQGFRPRYRPAPPTMRTRPGLRDMEAMMGETDTSEPPARIIADPVVRGYEVQMVDADGDGTPDRGALHTKIITHDAAPEAAGTLVIVGDSFADFVMPLFTPAFARIVKIHHGSDLYTVGTDEILSYDPDAVLLLVVERSAHRKDRPVVVGPTIREGG